MTDINRYDLGWDINVAPNSDFSVTFKRNGVTETVAIDADDIITELGTDVKCLNGIPINVIYPYNPITPEDELTLTDWSDTSFVDALAAAALTATTAAGWPTYLNFTIASNGKLTIAANDGTTSFRVYPQNYITQWILGHGISYATTYSASHEGQHNMIYSWAPTLGYRANDSGIYCSEEAGSLAMPASGAQPFGIKRGVTPSYWDFSHRAEPYNRIYGDKVVDTYTQPFGWNTMFAHCSKGYPFVALADVEPYHIYWLRSNRCNPKKMFGDFNDLWEIPFQTYYWGYCVEP